jgi:hypothetical protein
VHWGGELGRIGMQIFPTGVTIYETRRKKNEFAFFSKMSSNLNSMIMYLYLHKN